VTVERTRWGVVLLAICAGIVGSAHIGKVSAALPYLRADMGLSLVAGGWMASLISLSGAVTGAGAGMLADRLGHRRIALTGLFLMAFGDVTGALAGTAPLLFLSRFVEGAGFVITVVAVPSLMIHVVTARHRSFVLGVWGVYMGLGMSLALFLAPFILAPFGWRGLWLAAAAPALLCLAALGWATRDLVFHRVAGGIPWTDIAAAFKLPGPWFLAACFACFTLQWVSLMVWLPTFLIEQRGLSGGEAGFLAALVILINVLGSVGAGWLLHLKVPRAWIIAGCLVVVGLSAQGIFSSALADETRFALCLLFSAVGGLLPAAILAGAPLHAASPRQVGLVNGMLVQGSHVGTTLGPPIIAAIVSMSGNWEASAWAMSGAAMAGLVLAYAVARIESRLGEKAETRT
jgi:MFS family permease